MITDGLQIIIIGTAAVFVALAVLAAAAWIMAFVMRRLAQQRQEGPVGAENRCAIAAAVSAAIARFKTERKGS